jgi:hypothetical protein
MLRNAISAFTRVFDALCLAAWCAADPGSIVFGGVMSPGSAEQREMRCTASGTRETIGFTFQTATSFEHAFALPRRDAPELCMNQVRQRNRGRRECRAPDAPAASCAKVESTRVRNHGHAGNHPAFPTQWF